MDPPDAAIHPKCPHCLQTFATNATLKRHVEVIHAKSSAKVHVCKECKKSFLRKDHLNRHKNTSGSNR